MTQLLQRYLQYRRVGFGRLAAFHYAWMVTSAGTGKPLTLR